MYNYNSVKYSQKRKVYLVSPMKKLLSLLLIFACVLTSAVGCGGGENPEPTETKTLEEIVNSSVPTKVVTRVTYKYPEEHALAKYTLGGIYSLETDDGNAILTYDYTRFATVEDMADSMTVNVVGAIYSKDGKFSTDGENWENGTAQGLIIKFDIKAENFTTYEKSKDGRTLTATVSGDGLENVLGYKVSASGDVTVTVKTNGVYLTSIVLAYTTESGANALVETSYSYSDLTLVFPGEE